MYSKHKQMFPRNNSQRKSTKWQNAFYTCVRFCVLRMNPSGSDDYSFFVSGRPGTTVTQMLLLTTFTNFFTLLRDRFDFSPTTIQLLFFLTKRFNTSALDLLVYKVILLLCLEWSSSLVTESNYRVSTQLRNPQFIIH